MAVLRVVDLGKAYKKYSNRWSRLAEWCLPSAGPRHQLHWVLRNITFNLAAGDAMGIVGMNGAGKSTLLKIIAGTTHPTVGSVLMNGRVSALLELGMGFHPEFTGRQNVMMAGQLFGFSAKEVEALMPGIESFAEIGEYIDQPIRTYSSGMQIRLAFSVATAKRPDLLIVDEALAVGDSYFQHKSFDRIRKFRESGTTLLLVSHDRGAIQSICNSALLLHEGKLIKQGKPEETLDLYHALMAERDIQRIRQVRQSHGGVQTISGNAAMSVSKIQLINEKGDAVDAVETGTPVSLRLEITVNEPIDEAVVGFMIKDRFGQIIYGINSYRLGKDIKGLDDGEQLVCDFKFPMNLGKGNYSVATALSEKESHLTRNYEWRDGGFVFAVLNTKKPDFVGSVALDAVMDVRYRNKNQH